MLNSLDGIGNEYYFKLNEDSFSFPDFGLNSHNQIEKDNLVCVQAVLTINEIYDNVTIDEKTNAENTHYFEVLNGSNHLGIYAIPKGTSTIYSFKDSQNPIIESGGFLVDYSNEDQGKYYLSLVQDNPAKHEKKRRQNNSGKININVQVLGERVEVIGRANQKERWLDRQTEVLFRLLVPALFKSFIKGESSLINNKKFLSAFSLTVFSICFRFLLFIFLCLPFVCNCLLAENESLYKHLSLFVLAILADFLILFTMYSYVNGKISIAPLKLICFEPGLTIPYLKNLLNRMPGKKSTTFLTDNLEKNSNKNYLGIFALLLNIFSLLTLKHYNLSLIFWPSFNVMLIGVGLFLFSKHKFKPDKSIWFLNFKVSHGLFLMVGILFTILNILFFILDFDHAMKALQLTLYFIMLYSFITILRLMLLNFILINKPIN
jgi:hypothetical protein